MPELLPYGVYISGPMTGCPDFNYPLFNEVAEAIRTERHPQPYHTLSKNGQRWNVYPINPAANFDGRTDLNRENYLELALKQVDECKAIVLLPYWFRSHGSRLEVIRGLRNQVDFYCWNAGTFTFSRRTEVQEVLDKTQAIVTGNPLETGPSLTEAVSIEKIEEEAARLVRNGKRQATYGHPKGDFMTIARIWSAILTSALGHEVTCTDELVAIMMAGLKLARLSSSPKHRDSQVDTIGYMICLSRLDEEPEPDLSKYLEGEIA